LKQRTNSSIIIPPKILSRRNRKILNQTPKEEKVEVALLLFFGKLKEL